MHFFINNDMVQSEKQQVERNILKHRNYIRFLKRCYKGRGCALEAAVAIRKLVGIERAKKCR